MSTALRLKQAATAQQPQRPVIHGIQLISQLQGAHTNVGPNALLKSGSYPAVPDTAAYGPLTTVPAPVDDDFWRMTIPFSSGGAVVPALWTPPDTATYVYNNDPSNLGGIIPDGGLTIDGFPYAAGTYVFQFMDFSQAGDYMGLFDTWTPDTVFRGCRSRNSLGAPGFLSMQGFAGTVAFHYCDIGCPSAAVVAGGSPVGLQMSGMTGNCRFYRNYISYTTTGIFPNVGGWADVIENYIEKITLSTGAHLNGISFNGGNGAFRVLRNSVVVVTPDENGADINQTDCFAMFDDFGGYTAGGTNSDDTTGYFVESNYVGGTGYCLYLGVGSGAPQTKDLTFNGNLVTTSAYVNGGNYGPLTDAPAWGQNGNTETGNKWADGITPGASLVTPETQYQYVDAFTANTATVDITTADGDTLVAYVAAYIDSDTQLHLTDVTDSAGNTWIFSTAAASQNPPANGCYDTSEHYYGFSAIAYCIDAEAVTSVTITLNTAAHFIGLGASELALASDAYVDAAASVATLLTGVSGFTTPAVTTTQVNDFIVTTCSCDSGWLDTSSPPRFYVENGPGIVNVADGVVFAPGVHSVTFAGSGPQDVQGVCILAFATGI